jgi:tRNA (mo5U34)-methyltransferase
MGDYNSINWYHKFEIEPGVWTDGAHKKDVAAQFRETGVPDNLIGERVLDVGCYDGIFSFGAAKRGAVVLATDIQPETNGFRYLKNMMRDNVHLEYKKQSVYDMDYRGEFDRVLFYGVYYHLEYPVLGFQRLYEAIKPGGMIHVEGEIYPNELIQSRPFCYFEKGKYKNDETNFHIPTLTCLRAWMEYAGFIDIHLAQRGCRAYGSGVKP